MWAEEVVYKTALFGSDYNSQSVSSYSNSWTATNNGFTVNLANWNNNNNGWNYIKAGHKNTAYVGTITTADAIDKAVTKIVVTIDAITAANVTSIKLYSGSAADACTTEIGSFDKSTGIKTVTITSPATNKFYKIAFDCIAKTNGCVQVSKVEYYYDKTTGGGDAPEPTKYTVNVADDIANGTVTASTASATEGTEVTLTATPATGYEFGSWNVTNASTSAAITVTDNKFTMPAANVNVSATFNAKAGRPENEIFYESFDTNDGTGGNDDQWSGSIASNKIKQDNDGWVFENGSGANECAKFGAGSKLGTATTPALGQACNATLTFKAAAWNGNSESTTLKLSVIDGGSVSPATVTMTKGAWNDFEVTLTNLTASSKIKFEGNATSNSRFFLDEVSVVKTSDVATLQSVTVSGSPTKTIYFAGENFDPAGLTVTGHYDDNTDETITEGITWSTPAALTVGQTSVGITATVKGLTSAEYTVTGLTVNEPVTLIGITASGTPAEFWKGDAFNHDGMTVTATYTDGSNEDVTSTAVFSGYDMATAGNQTVIVTYGGKTASYEIIVRTIGNAESSAYTVSEAIEKIKAGKDLETPVFVRGIISQVDKLGTSGGITFWISEDGTLTSTQFEMFYCMNIEGTEFESTDDVQVGATIVAYGPIIYYAKGEVYEMNAGNLVSYVAPEVTTYNVTVANDIQHGTVTASVDEAAEGVTVELTVTPAAHYTLDVVTVVDADENAVSVSDNKFVMPASDVTVSATFRELEKVNVNWYVNGVKKQTDNIYTDEKVTAPTVDPIDGYTFVGWAATAVSEETETKPELVDVKDGYAPTTSLDLYAVYSRTEGEGGEAHDYVITEETKGFPTGYGDMRYVSVDEQAFYLTDVAYYSQYNTTMQFKKNTGEVYNATALASTISKIIVEYKDGSEQGLTVYSGAEYQPTANKITGVANGNTTTYTVDADYFTLKNETSNVVYVESITISCGGGNSTTYYTTSISTLDEITLEENSSTAIAENIYDKVTVNRTIKAKTWSTLCLPFDMDDEQIDANFGEDAEIRELAGLSVNGDNFAMKFTEGYRFIYAGTPVMIRTTKPISSIVVSDEENGIEVKSTTSEVDVWTSDEANCVAFYGSYVNTEVPANNSCYVISNNNFYLVDSKVVNKGFRGYFEVLSDSESNSRVLFFDFDNVITAIEGVTIEGLDDNIYNLQGQRVVRAQKGVYVANGRKVIY